MEKRRTTSQNRALHKYFEDVATELLSQGIERKTVMDDLEGYSVPVDASFMKEVWRAIQFTQMGKKSTTELETHEVNKVFETFNRFLAENYAVHCPFPSMESLTLAYVADTL